MIKERWFPFQGVVAVNAVRDPFPGELSPVDVIVAVFALRRRALEIYVDQLGFQIGRLVTVHTGCRPVRAHQWKCGLRVIESG